jgi:8-oxo-dGTP pyrophosphatase MutT (NUDIX family)
LKLALIEHSFPYYEDSPIRYTNIRSLYWEFHLRGGSGPHGYIPNDVVKKMPWGDAWNVNPQAKSITPKLPEVEQSQSDTIRKTLDEAREREIFRVLKGWRNELYLITGNRSQYEKRVTMERAGSALFGINSYGVHMTVYVRTEQGMKIWVPRRAKNKSTYGGMLDNTVAGGISNGEQPFECMVREAAEEASLPEELVRSNAKACGTVSYVHIRDERAQPGAEVGLFQPECQHIYDMEVGPEVIPKPCDNEVEDFCLRTVEEVQKALVEGQFKPNCAAVLVDFFIRHGVLTAENEPDYVEIVSRLHRKLPFPTS